MPLFRTEKSSMGIKCQCKQRIHTFGASHFPDGLPRRQAEICDYCGRKIVVIGYDVTFEMIEGSIEEAIEKEHELQEKYYIENILERGFSR